MIYLDHAATTPVHPAVIRAMEEAMQTAWGNPSSLHAGGEESSRLLAQARRDTAALIGAGPQEIVFTSGGTESDNQALLAGAALHPARRHVIVSAVEHPAVLNAAKRLAGMGYEVSCLPPDAEGFITPKALSAALRPDTALVSVMAANNEIGTIEPIGELAALAHEAGALFHTDAVQAYGQIPLNVAKLRVDLLSASAHKLGGPKGIGLLYVREGTPLAPLLVGGHQQGGRRAGTENVPAAAGFAIAAGLAAEGLAQKAAGLAALRDHFLHGLWEAFGSRPGFRVNGSLKERLPGNAHISLPPFEASAILFLLDAAGICASGGSACSSGEEEPSHVLTAIGLSPREARSSLRFTLGAENTKKELDETVRTLAQVIAQLEEAGIGG